MLPSVSAQRFVAWDVHKHYVVVGAVNAQQQVGLAPRRVELDDLADWAQIICARLMPSCWKPRPMPGICAINFTLWSHPSR
jgi:hypothetical protein